MTNSVQQLFQRYKPFAKPKPNAASQTGHVGTAQQPGVFASQSMRPERLLPQIQRNAMDPHCEFRAFGMADGMHRR